jgi:hypothetical protein
MDAMDDLDVAADVATGARLGAGRSQVQILSPRFSKVQQI